MQRINLVVIEDNQGDARLVEIMLREANQKYGSDLSFEFIFFGSLKEAQEGSKSVKANVILLDLGLPDSYGIETVEKACELFKDTPIIAYTGTDDIALGKKIVALGAVGYLVKGESTSSVLLKTLLFGIEQFRLKSELAINQQILFEKNRTLRMLSNCNQALIRNKDEQSLLDAMSTVMQKEGGYSLVWVGFTDENTETIRVQSQSPAALLSLEEIDMKEMKVSFPECPISKCVREKKIFLRRRCSAKAICPVCKERMITDENLSLLVMPLYYDDALYGVIAIFSTKEGDGVFAEEEISMLTELSKDIGFGIYGMRLQKEAKRLLEQNALLLESAEEGIFGVDKDLKITFVNSKACVMLGYTKDEMLGLNKHSAFHYKKLDGSMYPQEECPIFETLNYGTTHLRKYDLYFKKNGDSFNVDYTSSPIIKEGEIIGAVVVFQDVTEKMEADKRIKMQEQMMISQSRQAAMGEMISMIAHQWRQPISTIGMAINNLKVDIDLGMFDPKEADKQYEEISELLEHLSSTIDDFRDFFREDREKESESMDVIIRDTLCIIGKSLENNEIKIKLNLNSSLSLPIFKREMIQVFLNIIKNAKDALLEHGVEEPFVEISTKTEEGSVEVNVVDNGGGIKDEVISHIFEPYFTTKDLSSGTGLGLYMSKIIVEQHHKGEISAKNYNGGVCFSVRIPTNL